MAEELGTRDVLEQVDTRLGTIEQDIRSLDSKVDARFERMHEEIVGVRSEMNGLHNGLRSDMNARFESTIRWIVGLIFASWLTLMASIWLKL